MKQRVNWLHPAATENECRERLAALSSEYAAQRSVVRRADYDEVTARQDFIDPLFAALGWDVANQERKFGKERDVVPEAKATGQRDRPDYAFRVEGKPKFFVEAKKPAVELESPEFIFQAKRYAYSRSAAACVLTNYERFLVYQAAIEPKLDEPHMGRLLDLDLTYDRYAQHAGDLWRILGRENVREGSIENYVLGERAPMSRRGRLRGFRTVDDAFLVDLTSWRAGLAAEIARSNKFDDAQQLVESVQRVLDRLIFIRVCEDRGIEPQLLMKPIVDAWRESKKKTGLYPALVDLFQKLEPEYNSHLFKKHRSEHMRFQDEGVLATVIDALYPPRSPYRFDALSVDILGTVYERFLGQTIELVGQKTKVIEKPEVRHSGGIVYTPRWVVKEIVANALGPRIAGKSPVQLAKLRILDPACGSGSFLLGAAQALFDQHITWYRENALDEKGGILKEHREDVFIDPAEEVQLTVKKRREIILRCLYGIDKDPQAVEVAQLSLYLRILEGYGEQAYVKQKNLFKGALLPDLTRHIKIGNTLITPSDLPADLAADEERLRRLRAFEWDSPTRGFGKVKSAGGFDVIIGNPPYIRIQQLNKFAPDEVEILRTLYPASAEKGFDIYLAFVEKALRELKESGALGFILPPRWMKANYGRALRTLVSSERSLSKIVDFGPTQVFDDVTTYTAMQFFRRKRNTKFRYEWHQGGEDDVGLGPQVRAHDRSFNGLSESPWYPGVTERLVPLFDRLRALPDTLGTASAAISQGIKTGRDPIFVLHEATTRGNLIRGRSKESDRIVEIEAEACKWLIKSGEMRRYELRRATRVVLFPYQLEKGVSRLIKFEALKAKWPRFAAYLEEHEDVLRKREIKVVKKVEKRPYDVDGEWHRFSRYQNMELPSQKKIVVADVLDTARFAYDEGASVCFMGGAAGGYGIVLKDGWDPWAVTAILNSTLSEWLLRPPGFSDWYAGGYFSGEKRFIQNLPLPASGHSAMSALGKAARDLHGLPPQRAAQNLAKKEAARLSGLATSLEATIDDLVFKAFGIAAGDRVAISDEVASLRAATRSNRAALADAVAVGDDSDDDDAGNEDDEDDDD